MINKISKNVAVFFIKNNLIQVDEIDIYIYGLQLIISSILGISIILFLGIISERLTDSLIFLFCFIILRQYSGGYHANSYLKCNLYFITIFLLTEAAVIYTQAKYKDVLTVGLICISFVIILRFAPIDNINKKLSNSQKLKNKKITLIIFVILITISIFMKVNDVNYYYNIAVTILSVTALMIIQKIKEAKQWKN
ncbi:accessory gene regulator B family protein [Sedimentibacter sp.]|uniref:accessory gene regulator ArgB-like protein n=1 Tax=Sedimentibacter sp. TaxID=1960295 RepID=UPI0028986409|nr:accessory gene regulator B family protein [Sedimentibacter sp.]